MNVDEVIKRCESRPITEDRKMMLALAREVKRFQGAGSKSQGAKAKSQSSE